MNNEPAGGANYRSLIDASKLSRLQWTIFTLCFLIMFLDGFDTVLIGFLAPYIGADWKLPKAALTPVFTAGVVGLMLAGCLAGVLADRVGRRPLLLGAVALFGVANLATASCASLDGLIAWRFVTGLGLGAALPCAVALVAEYAPARRRALIITSLYCGYTLGGAAVGALTPLLAPQHGWRVLLLLGAALPLVLAVLLWRLLPESIAFLAERRRDHAAVAILLQRITGGHVELPADQGQVASPPKTGQPLRLIMRQPYRAQTLLLWLANGCGLMIMFTLINWLPSFLSFKHVPLPTASISSTCLQIGGIGGTLLIGWLMDRVDGRKVVALAYVGVAGLSLLWLYAVARGDITLVTMGLLAGLLVMGGQTGFQVMAAAVYPVEARATGLSWMQCVGRVGGILGISLAGMGLARDIDPVIMLQALAIPALVAATAAALLKGRGGRTVLPAQPSLVGTRPLKRTHNNN